MKVTKTEYSYQVTECDLKFGEEIILDGQKLIPIPDNATNGDMIKAMFPNGKYGTNGEFVHVYGVGGNGCLGFTLKWWNAPYKRI